MEEILSGGNAGGAVLVDGTVRRPAGPWTPTVHALLEHLARHGFAGAPRALGRDDQDREILSFLPGDTIGDRRPWPTWVHSDAALEQVGQWLRGYHHAVRDFVPSDDAIWRVSTEPWHPGEIIGHNDAAPYNAVWRSRPGDDDRLVGFIDWDFAGPCPAVWDLAFVAFSWVPLHARDVVAAEGFERFHDRPRRLRLLLDAYGWSGTVEEVLDAVHRRVEAHLEAMHTLAVDDPLFARLLDAGAGEALQRALAELSLDRSAYRDVATGPAGD